MSNDKEICGDCGSGRLECYCPKCHECLESEEDCSCVGGYSDGGEEE